MELSKTIGITQKSAWYLLHKIRYMLEHRNSDNQLRGTVEVDETYIGGKKKGKRGRGSEKQDTSIRGGAAQRSLVNYTSGEYQTHNIGADNPYTDKRRFYNRDARKSVKNNLTI